jgi:hypothetical protein
MSVFNSFISFLRHYGPIPASDNMYDELIQAEIDRYGISPPIQIEPARLKELIENFSSPQPSNVILTGTAGDGKTYHCRRVWEHFGGDRELWQNGEKIVKLKLPASGKQLILIKDLSELMQQDKQAVFPDIAAAVTNSAEDSVFLIAANDGQLLEPIR